MNSAFIFYCFQIFEFFCEMMVDWVADKLLKTSKNILVYLKEAIYSENNFSHSCIVLVSTDCVITFYSK